MTSMKDDLVLEDCTRRFMKCPKCFSMLKVTDFYNGEAQPPAKLTKKENLQINHEALTCPTPQCDYFFPSAIATNYRELHQQIREAYMKYISRMMLLCTSCHKRLLADASYYCTICHKGHNQLKTSLCASCAIRDHPGGEEHHLDEGIRQNSHCSDMIATLLTAANTMDDCVEVGRNTEQEKESLLRKMRMFPLQKEAYKQQQQQEH